MTLRPGRDGSRTDRDRANVCTAGRGGGRACGTRLGTAKDTIQARFSERGTRSIPGQADQGALDAHQRAIWRRGFLVGVPKGRGAVLWPSLGSTGMAWPGDPATYPPVVKTRLTGVGTSATLPVGVSSPVC